MIDIMHRQEEKTDETGWVEPIGFHLIPLPFADDIRAATVTTAMRGITCLNPAECAG